MNTFERFKKSDFPEHVQNRIVSFASFDGRLNEGDAEYWFRAGFYCYSHCKEIDSENDGNDWLMVRKNELNLDWYRKARAMISGGSR